MFILLRAVVPPPALIDPAMLLDSASLHLGHVLRTIGTDRNSLAYMLA